MRQDARTRAKPGTRGEGNGSGMLIAANVAVMLKWTNAAIVKRRINKMKITTHPVIVADLKMAPTRAFLYCPVCGERNSATAGDYWHLAPGYEFEHCGEPMVLATEEKRIVPCRL